MTKRTTPPQSIEQKEWSSAEEIERAIGKLRRRIEELKTLDIKATHLSHDGKDNVAISNVRETIRDVFGSLSPEFREHQFTQLWAGPMFVNMPPAKVLEGKELGRTRVIGVLDGLIARLSEKREEFADTGSSSSKPPSLQYLNLHPRIADVASELFEDGHPWEAVFAAAKALVNYVKERSGKHDLDGASLMRTVFSRNDPLLAFNDMQDQTELDEQEGMMHLFEGAVLGIRNPGGHTFPEGPEQRAIEYLSLLSLLAFRVQEAKRMPRRSAPT